MAVKKKDINKENEYLKNIITIQGCMIEEMLSEKEETNKILKEMLDCIMSKDKIIIEQKYTKLRKIQETEWSN